MSSARNRLVRASAALANLVACWTAADGVRASAPPDVPPRAMSQVELRGRAEFYCLEIQNRPEPEPRDPSERTTVRTLAEQHVANCMRLDAIWAEREGDTRSVDYAALLPLYEVAAAENDAAAQVALGALYERGQAVGIDREEAAEWYRLAAYQRDARGWAALDRLQRDGAVPDEAAAARDRAVWMHQFARTLRPVLEEQIRSRSRPAAPAPVTLRITYAREHQRPEVAIVRGSGIRGFDAAGIDAVTSLEMPAAPVYASPGGRWSFEYSIRPGAPD